jgi:aspartyl-tRNA(Asn)/glutamyl-tRNA(Gln) amidotransferase subunit B
MITPEVLAKYQPVIGLEVHVQLLTESKAFCGCVNKYGGEPNTHICPTCLGLPGALPVLNRRAVEFAVLAARAINCEIRETSIFARKNYFYPDSPKGYQISQYDKPIAEHGWIEVPAGVSGAAGAANGGAIKKRIGVTRLHLEEDAGKSLHDGFADSVSKTYIDLNRCGTPLVEIVSEPDLRTADEVFEYLTRLKEILLYTGVSDCNMEEGSLRCDANVSVRLKGAKEFGTKVEVKNLNSFRFLVKALEHEIERHIGVIENGGKIIQETRLWNQAEGYTVGMRSKEKAHDYRYFPEPDLLPVHVSTAWREQVQSALPELPAAKRDRFVLNYGITAYDAGVLTGSSDLALYFEQAVKAGAPGKAAANWMQTELLRRLNDSGKEITASPVSPASLAELIKLVEGGKITAAVAKKVFAKMFEDGRNAAAIVEAEGLGAQVSSDSLEETARQVIERNPENVAKYKSGNAGVFKFFVGQVMKGTRGQADPQAVNDILHKLLG